MEEKKLKLISILKLMGIKSISEIKGSEDPTEDHKSFELRLRIQKIMFFLNRNNLDGDLNYSYSIYLRGPYSPDLAKDYFTITEDEFNEAKNLFDNESLLKRTIEFLNKKDLLWLEVASTLRYLIDGGYEKDEAIDRVMELKDYILKENNKDYNYVKGVLEEMEENNELHL